MKKQFMIKIHEETVQHSVRYFRRKVSRNIEIVFMSLTIAN